MRHRVFRGLPLVFSVVCVMQTSCVTINQGGSGGDDSTSTGGGIGGELTATAGAGGTGSTSGSTSTGSVTCGDGALDASEECDDGNATRCDGCETCTRQYVLDLPAQAYVASPSAKDALPPLDSDACYEAWGKTDGTLKDAIYLASVPDPYHINVILRCLSINGKLTYAVDNGAPDDTSIPPIIVDGGLCGDNQWHHVAGCRDVDGTNVTLTLFLDGKLIGTKTGKTAQIAPPTTVYVGGLNYGQEGLAGSIDEVRVSNTLRYTGDFVPQRHFAPDANTTLLWKFDEGAGSSVTDASGNGFEATIVGGSFGVDAGYRPEFCQTN